MPNKRWISYTIIAALLIAALAPPRVFAHGGHQAAGMQTFTQMVGPYELAVTVELPLATPAPLYLTLVSPQNLAGTTVTFRAAPRGYSFEGAPTAQVQGLGMPTTYLSELPIERPGDWDIEVSASGPEGDGSARLPITVVVQPLPITSIVLFAAIGTLIVLMLTNILLSVLYQRRGRALPRGLNWAMGQGMFACVIVTIIFGIQQANAQFQSAVAASAVGDGRPHANMVLATVPPAPIAGQPLSLTLDLSDGSTGLPVDDIVPHHEALLHLVILSADGADFAHVHPARVAPGRYTISFTPAQPGRYTAYAEIQRQDSGTQVITSDFEVGGAAVGAAPPAPPGLGPREVAGMQVDVSSSVTPLKAGKQATLTFNFSADGAPVQDLQPWLGMAGHLIARRTDGALFSHIHAAEQMPPSDPLLASGTVYGPSIRFAYTFPQPGRYQLWAQFQRAGKIITVPLIVEVS
jgi:hypothetical protein